MNILVLLGVLGFFWKEGGVPFQGEFYNLSRLQDEFIPESLGDIRVPEIWLTGPKLSALAAEQCDGFITHPTIRILSI